MGRGSIHEGSPFAGRRMFVPYGGFVRARRGMQECEQSLEQVSVQGALVVPPFWVDLGIHEHALQQCGNRGPTLGAAMGPE